MTSIFVGNLPYSAEESDLRSQFERYGRVRSVRIVTDGATNRPRGFAFVEMPSLDEADEAITRLSGTCLGGRTLTINESQSSRGTADTGRSGGGARDKSLELFAALLAD